MDPPLPVIVSADRLSATHGGGDGAMRERSHDRPTMRRDALRRYGLHGLRRTSPGPAVAGRLMRLLLGQLFLGLDLLRRDALFRLLDACLDAAPLVLCLALQ